MNFRILILTFSLLCTGLTHFAQNAYVYDIDDLKPVPEVFIIDHHFNNSITADKKGVVDLSGFNKSDTLIIQHPSYNQLIVTISEISAANNAIYLTESAVDLQEFTVMANKRKQLESEVPNMIVPISKKDVEFTNPQTSADLLQNSGEVFVQKSQMGGGSPMIRGFAANRVLIVVDGVRMNNAIFRSGNLQNIISIDPNNIEGAEVIYGPGSVIYGSDALGGVMNFRTTETKLSYVKDSMLVYGNALARYSTANNELTGHVQAGVGTKKFGVLFGFTLSSFGDLEAGAVYNESFPDFGKRNWYQSYSNSGDTIVANSNPQLQRSTGYNQQNIMLKTRYQATSKIDLNLNMHYSTTSNIPRYDRLTQVTDTAPTFARWFYGPQDWFLGSVHANFDFGNDAWDRSGITIAYQRFNESRNDRKYNSPYLRNREDRVNVYTANFDFDKYIGKKHTLYYGIEGVYNQVYSAAQTQDITTDEISGASTRYPDGGSYWTSAAAYLTYKWKVNPKFILSTGVRYTYIEMESNFNDTNYFNFPYKQIHLSTSALNGSFIGLTYKPGPKWHIGFNSASGFRAPNIDDLAKVFDSEPGKVIVPNPDLKPEYSYNTELRFARELSYKGKVELVGFYNYLIDAMVRRSSTFEGQDSIIYDGQLSQVQMITNAGRAHIYGASFNLKVNITRHIGIIQTFTWLDGEDLIEHVPLRHVSPAFGKTSFFFKSDKIRAEVYSHYNAWRHWDELAPEEQGKPHLYTTDGTPAWFTINLRGEYVFNSTLSTTVAIENLLDHHYRPYSSGVSAAGRNFIFALRANF